MRYLPLTESDRRAMLAAIGVPSVDSLFRDVPETARDPVFDLPDHAGEIEVERDLGALAAHRTSPPARRRSSSAPAPIATTCRRASTR